LKGGAIGGLTGAGFGWASGIGPVGVDPSSAIAANSFERYAAHALVGCASSVAGGGRCESGAAGAVFGKFATNHWIGETVQGKWDTRQFVATVVSGGVGSVIGGGKFENGAMTAAYGYLYNQLSPKNYKDQRLSMADRAAGLSGEEGKTRAFEEAFAEARPKVAEFFDKGSKVFIYGGGIALLTLPTALTGPAIPLILIGGGMDMLSDVLDPKPIKITTDSIVDKVGGKLMQFAGAAGSAAKVMLQSVKDMKNLTPLGDN
jgi:hypothetical protein